MQLAAFLCVICAICGRIYIQLTQSIYTNETPVSPADFADLRRRTPKQQNSLNLKQPVFLCVIMQPAAFLCVICVICGRIFTQEYSIYITQTKPQCLPQISQITQTKPKTTKQPNLTKLSFSA